jgi:hypothetical protein
MQSPEIMHDNRSSPVGYLTTLPVSGLYNVGKLDN